VWRGVAPGQSTLGFMLPYTPLHILLMQSLERPIVLTSGNRSEEPQCIHNAEALERLAGIADAFLLHDREILNRVDDSVVRVMGGSPGPCAGPGAMPRPPCSCRRASPTPPRCWPWGVS
jgi:hydrogenase maturation protein HypF